MTFFCATSEKLPCKIIVNCKYIYGFGLNYHPMWTISVAMNCTQLSGKLGKIKHWVKNKSQEVQSMT